MTKFIIKLQCNAKLTSYSILLLLVRVDCNFCQTEQVYLHNQFSLIRIALFPSPALALYLHSGKHDYKFKYL